MTNSATEKLVFGASTGSSVVMAFGLSLFAWANRYDSFWFRMVAIVIFAFGYTGLHIPSKGKQQFFFLLATILCILTAMLITVFLQERIFTESYAASTTGILLVQAIVFTLLFIFFRWGQPMSPPYTGKHSA